MAPLADVGRVAYRTQMRAETLSVRFESVAIGRVLDVASALADLRVMGDGSSDVLARTRLSVGLRYGTPGPPLFKQVVRFA